MSEARDIEEIVAWMESGIAIGPGVFTVSVIDLTALIADWRAKKAEIERMRTSRDLCENELDVLSASHKDLAHRLARSGEENERIKAALHQIIGFTAEHGWSAKAIRLCRSFLFQEEQDPPPPQQSTASPADSQDGQA